jgi:hypothetical protein
MIMTCCQIVQRTLLITLLFAYVNVLHAQTFTTIAGTVTDDLRIPLSYASIALKGRSEGIVSSESGSFAFHFKKSNNNDTLTISCIGHETLVLPVSVASAHYNKFQLQRKTELLDTVIFLSTRPSAKDIILEAINRIPENYNGGPHLLKGFFRDWKMVDFTGNEKDQSLLIEAAVNVFDRGISGNKKDDKKKIYLKALRRQDLPEKGWNYFNSLAELLNSNPIENKDVSIFKLPPVLYSPDQYEFKYQPIDDNEKTIKIIATIPGGNFTHTFFIEAETLAFTRVDLECFPFISGSWKINSVNNTLRYKQWNGKWYLNYSRKNWAIENLDPVTSAPLRKEEYYVEVLFDDIVLTTDPKVLEPGTLMDQKKPLELLPINADSEFWKHYNVIENENLHERINSFQRKSKNEMRKLFGRYALKSDSTRELEITEQGSYLIIREKNVWEAFLNPISNLTYEIKNVKPQAILSFQSTNEKITGLIVSQGKKAYEWTRKDIDSKPADSARTKVDTQFSRADSLRGKLSAERSCYDVTFYHLDVTVDMDKRSIKGKNLMRFKVTKPFTTMQVDLYANMTIERIVFDEQEIQFRREFNAVFITLPRQLTTGDNELTIYYNGTPKEPDLSIPMNGGFLWGQDEEKFPWMQVVCQGSGASLWWPNKDHLSDEPDSMKIWITLPDKFDEVSNGTLIRKTLLPDNLIRHEWFVSYPINNYNVTMSVGKYVHITDRYVDKKDTFAIHYYVKPYHQAQVENLKSEVRPMLKCYQEYFGSYPFKRDGFAIVESLYPMEHQSGVCIGKLSTEISKDTKRLIWHESAHEWWGNNISCTDMADLWIHEAFATYGEWLVLASNYSQKEADDFWLEQELMVKNELPVVGYYDVNHIFYDINDMYCKGALILHTFRQVLNNDELWFTLLRDIQKHFAYQTLTSNDLIAFVNLRTANDYSYFFNQYLHHAELPILNIQLGEQSTGLTLKYRWEANVADFRMPVRMTIAMNKFELITPTTEWQTLQLDHLEQSDFQIDDENILMSVNFR